MNRVNGDVFAELAESYEHLKLFSHIHIHRSFTIDDDYKFYKALRCLYFANVACWLCQYHDDTPLPSSELAEIETFADFKPPTSTSLKSPQEHVKEFLDAWGSLTYNLVTNDGELYKPVESYEYRGCINKTVHFVDRTKPSEHSPNRGQVDVTFARFMARSYA